MKRWLLLLPLLLFAIPAHSQTFVRKSTECHSTTSTTTTCAFSSNTAGNTIIFSGYSDSTTSTSMADGAGNTYTAKVNLTDCSASGFKWVVFEADNIAASAGTNTITWTTGPTNRTREGEAFEYSGLKASSSFDQSACTNLAAQTAPTSGNVTTSKPNELIFVQYSGASFAITSTDGTSSRSTDSTTLQNYWGDKKVTSIGSYAATGTSSSQTAFMGVATFISALQPTAGQVGAFLVGP